jgi:hypothetical protein
MKQQGIFRKKCLCEGISCKQCDLDAELVATFSLFLELQLAVAYGLVNIMVCTVFI